MKNLIGLFKTGISIIDKNWGGFYKSGTYLLLGPKKSGRTLLSLQAAKNCLSDGKTCLFVTSLRTRDLIIQASTINFDVQSFVNNGQMIVIKATPPTDAYEKDDPDMDLQEYLKDIVALVEQYNPEFLIFDEFTPFVGFNSTENLNDAFLSMIEGIEQIGSTSLYILGEPATPYAREIIDVLYHNSTGKVVLQKNKEDLAHKFVGKISIIPNVGHSEGVFESSYIIEGNNGLVISDNIEKEKVNTNVTQIEKIKTESNVSPKVETQQAIQKDAIPVSPISVSPNIPDTRYITLSNFEINSEDYIHSNIYSMDDFILFVSNQLSLFRNTGQSFEMYCFKLDEFAIQGKLITLHQLQNVIRLSVDKKDKLCIHDNMIMLIIVKSDSKSFFNLIANMMANFPNQEERYIKNILRYISVLKIDNLLSYNNAEEVFKYIYES